MHNPTVSFADASVTGTDCAISCVTTAGPSCNLRLLISAVRVKKQQAHFQLTVQPAKPSDARRSGHAKSLEAVLAFLSN